MTKDMKLDECREELLFPDSSVLLVMENPTADMRWKRRIAEVERITWGNDIISVIKAKPHIVIFAQPYTRFEDAAKAAMILNKVWASQRELLE